MKQWWEILHYPGNDFGNFEPNPCIDIEKTTNDVDNVCDPETGEIIPVGDPITWGYTVTNCGNVISDVTVTDSEEQE